MDGPHKKAFCKRNVSHLAAGITDLNNGGFNLRGISISSMERNPQRVGSLWRNHPITSVHGSFRLSALSSFWQASLFRLPS